MAMNEASSYKVSCLAGGGYLSYPNVVKAVAGFNELGGVEASLSLEHGGLKIYIYDEDARLRVKEYAEEAGLRLCNMNGDVITIEPEPEDVVNLDLSEFEEEDTPKPDDFSM